LFFFCGKKGAGKSTKSKIVAAENNAVLISVDDWLSAHSPSQIAKPQVEQPERTMFDA